MSEYASPVDKYPMQAIPALEMETAIGLMRSHEEYASTEQVTEVYLSLGLKVSPDPYDQGVVAQIDLALRTKTPFSVVRIGDGEMNLLSFGRYPNSTHLDQYCAAASIGAQLDRFEPDLTWMLALREMMLSAVLQADVVGVLGLWRLRLHTIEGWIEQFSDDPRGALGQWRGVDYMLKLAKAGVLRGKTITSAHLYLGVIKHLNELLSRPCHVMLITDKTKVSTLLAERFPQCDFQQIVVGQGESADSPLLDQPEFLCSMDRNLPHDLSGSLCLVGAGPWAEIYCAWIKGRGGVAVDIGSGFDLLAGIISRPAHHGLGLDSVNPYAL
jgi:hypothetical protein